MFTSSPQPGSSLGARVGALIRLRRQKLGLTQKELGERVGLTAQQVQKYEQGTNAIRLQRLLDFSLALQCPLERFLTTASLPSRTSQSDVPPTQTNPPRVACLCEETSPFHYGGLSAPQHEELSREELDEFFMNFLALNPDSQRALALLVRHLSASARDGLETENAIGNEGE